MLESFGIPHSTVPSVNVTIQSVCNTDISDKDCSDVATNDEESLDQNVFKKRGQYQRLKGRGILFVFNQF